VVKPTFAKRAAMREQARTTFRAFCYALPLGRKVSDEFTVPLCRGHHREVHRSGDEAAWWNKTGIDPTAAARVLWLKTHPSPNVIGVAESKLPNEPNLTGGPP
jgi:hypothetical protein